VAGGAPADREPLPASIAPMLAVPAERLPDRDEEWGFEVKWDGVRTVVLVEEGRVRLLSRRANDVTVAYPEMAALGAALAGRPAVLDGEIVAVDERGRPSFAELQPRIHVADPRQAARLAASTPATLMVFDVLHLDGRSTLALPYLERRELLASLDLGGPHWRTAAYYVGGGEALAAAAREQGLEGVVAKLLVSRYLPGRRSESWRKVKNVATQDVVIGGFTIGEGSRAGSFGALLIGVGQPDGRLSFAGRVGSGFDDRALADLRGRLSALRADHNPFDAPLPRADGAHAVFVEPRLVGEVRFQQWTRDGRLRAPVWRGLRPDVDPAQVRREI
jgi:bifunctional non-homologous end joining protein LigD